MMKHFSLFLLVLILSGLVALSHVPKEVMAIEEVESERGYNLTSVESTNKNAVEIDGIRFEILVPNRVWLIPENQPDVNTLIQLAIRITNNSPSPIRLPFFDPLLVIPLEIVEADGKVLQSKGGRDRLLNSPQLACPLIQPGEHATFFPDTKVFWQKNSLLIGGSDGLGGSWYFDNIKPGDYQIRFRYISSRSVRPCYDPKKDEEHLIREIWTGEATTPFVKVYVVYPGT
ncbi:hypothetical protein [Microcoleus sp. PH2017_11_PCY_U_A]|uniref:hypothetical protein n=1 Tax=Microcoleus sp. PH2017_11_PCY_U_A TaxID=2798822 RepID=UPI0025E6A593|nr:hypothetical protein [Microcoleus sp. PH2017_11_PCY_U_A]